MARRFEIVDVNARQYRRYNAVRRQLTVRLITPPDNTNHVPNFLGSVNDLFEHALRDVYVSDMVAMTIENQVHQNDKPIGISFGRKDQLSADVIWSMFESLPVEF